MANISIRMTAPTHHIEFLYTGYKLNRHIQTKFTFLTVSWHAYAQGFHGKEGNIKNILRSHYCQLATNHNKPICHGFTCPSKEKGTLIPIFQISNSY